MVLLVKLIEINIPMIKMRNKKRLLLALVLVNRNL